MIGEAGAVKRKPCNDCLDRIPAKGSRCDECQKAREVAESYKENPPIIRFKWYDVTYVLFLVGFVLLLIANICNLYLLQP